MNGVPCFQRIIDEIMKSNKGTSTYAYLDNITVGRKTQEEHEANLEKFLKVAKDCNLTLNKDKCVYSPECINFLGYQINSGSLKPVTSRGIVKTGTSRGIVKTFSATEQQGAATSCRTVRLLRPVDWKILR